MERKNETTTEITTLLRCLACAGTVGPDLVCKTCGRKYKKTGKVCVMLDEALSGQEFKWDKSNFNPERMQKVLADYRSHINEESKTARELWMKAMDQRIAGLSGMVMDTASGMGSMLERLISSKADIYPVATDVDPNVLTWDIERLSGSGKTFSAVATDAKHLAFKDSTFDAAVSFSCMVNIPDVGNALREIYRVLKPGGRLISMDPFVDEGSKSHKLAEENGLERGIIKRFMTENLLAAQFSEVNVDIISSAVWAENPFDLLPAAGDRQHFAIFEAVKRK